VEEPSVRATPKTVLKRLSISVAVAILALVASMPLGMAGCNNQGEGERCTFFKGGDAGENGTDECSSGLVCVPTSYYTSITATTGGVGELGVCCPPAGTPATSAACMAMVGGSTMAGPPIGDGGFDGDTGAGATKDAGHDAPRDTGEAAPHDAGHDATHDATIGG
jgi:hypothetical protein